MVQYHSEVTLHSFATYTLDRHLNARYTKLNYSGATIDDKTLKSLLTQRYSHIAT